MSLQCFKFEHYCIQGRDSKTDASHFPKTFLNIQDPREIGNIKGNKMFHFAAFSYILQEKLTEVEIIFCVQTI